MMSLYTVHVIIENKPGISDPEGETILKDLVLKGSYSSVKKIRSAKMLKFKINEKNKALAEKKIKKLCDDLRIYNPMVSKITTEVFED
jgi:phosphoribosylformylglycinamidine synthase PurS subunit